MSRREGALIREVRAVLEAAGCTDWSVVPGKKHDKLIVRGSMVAVLTRCGGDKPARQNANLLACVRRAARAEVRA